MRLIHILGTKIESEKLEVWEGGVCVSTIYPNGKGVRITSSFARTETIEPVPFRAVQRLLKAVLLT